MLIILFPTITMNLLIKQRLSIHNIQLYNLTLKFEFVARNRFAIEHLRGFCTLAHEQNYRFSSPFRHCVATSVLIVHCIYDCVRE